MPARSKSQQRLFAMVHAYNKGELHCDGRLRKRIAALSKRISDEDARHFAETPHEGLPERTGEKRAALSDAELARMYDIVQADARLFRRLRALGLADAVRTGRGVRNRIVHEPGYVPSAADAARALREYEAAGRMASRAEKRAQVMVRPEALQDAYSRIPVGEYAAGVVPSAVRSERRRSFLGSVLYGTGAGAVLGGLGAAGLGAFIASNAVDGSGADPGEVRRRVLEAAARCGLWGAGRGAVAGTAVGAGLGILDKVRG